MQLHIAALPLHLEREPSRIEEGGGEVGGGVEFGGAGRGGGLLTLASILLPHTSVPKAALLSCSRKLPVFLDSLYHRFLISAILLS